MTKHYERNADYTFTKAGRAQRDADRDVASTATQKRIADTRAAGNAAHSPGMAMSQEANDTERLVGGTKNKEGLSGTGSERVNAALDKANVGAND